MQRVQKLNVVLVLKKGKIYILSDVLRLSTLLQHYRDNIDLNIYCLNDLFDMRINLFGINFIPFPYKEWSGWWAKMNMFHPTFKELRPFLYVDLDTLVLDTYAAIIPQKKDQFVTLEDFYQKGKLASGLMWIADNAKVIKIWNTWIRNPSLWITKYRGGDQVFIQNVVAADMFFQTYTSLVGSFKPVPSTRPLKSKPEKKAIICLHGNPRIHEVVETYGWVQEVLKEVV